MVQAVDTFTAPAARSRTRTLNVLLVEDNDIDVMNIRRAFKRAGLSHRLEVVEDAERALSVLANQDPEIRLPEERRLVLLDLNLPRVSGLDFLRELRSQDHLRTTAVVVLTSSDIEEDKAEAYRRNVAGYLIKPVGQEAFAELVSALDAYWSTSEFPPPMA
ncbi:MAG: response regulator [Planctomycetota bacterium]